MFNKERGPLGNGPMDFGKRERGTRSKPERQLFDIFAGRRAKQEASRRAAEANMAEEARKNLAEREARRSRTIHQLEHAKEAEPTEARLLPHFIGAADTIKRMVDRGRIEEAVELANAILLQTHQHNDRVAGQTRNWQANTQRVREQTEALRDHPIESLRIDFTRMMRDPKPQDGPLQAGLLKARKAVAGATSAVTEVAVRRLIAVANGKVDAYLNDIVVTEDGLTVSNPGGKTWKFTHEEAASLQFSVDPLNVLDVPLGILGVLGRYFRPLAKVQTPIGIIRVNQRGRDETLGLIPAILPERVIGNVIDTLRNVQPIDPSRIPQFVPEPSIEDLLRKGGASYTAANSTQTE